MNRKDRSRYRLCGRLVLVILTPALILIASGFIFMERSKGHRPAGWRSRQVLQTSTPVSEFSHSRCSANYRCTTKLLSYDPRISTLDEPRSATPHSMYAGRLRNQTPKNLLSLRPDGKPYGIFFPDPVGSRVQASNEGYVMQLVNRLENRSNPAKGYYFDILSFTDDLAGYDPGRSTKLSGIRTVEKKEPASDLGFFPHAFGASLLLFLLGGGCILLAVRAFPLDTESLEETGTTYLYVNDMPEQLQTSEATFRELAELLPLFIYECDHEGALIFLNQAGMETIGITKCELLKGMNVLDLVNPYDRDRMASDIDRLRSGEDVTDSEYSFLKKDGSNVRFFLNSSPMVLGGTTVGFRGLASNISDGNGPGKALRQLNRRLERKVTERTAELTTQNELLAAEMDRRLKAEILVQEQNEFLSNILESITHPFYVVDADSFEVLMANSAAGLDLSSAQATCYALTHQHAEPCTGSDHPCPVQEVKRTGKPVTTEHVHSDEAGNRRYMQIFAYPLRDAGGRVEKVIEYAVDITDRKQAEHALRENEERFHRFANEAASEGIIIHENGMILDVNETFASMYGYKPNELIGTDALKTVAHGSRETLERRIRGRSEIPYEATALRKDGSTFPIEIVAKEIRFRGKLVRAAAVRNLTEKKRAQEALRDSEERYRALFEQSPDAIVIVRPEGRIIDCNQSTCDLFGASREEIIGANIKQFYWNPSDRDGFRRLMDLNGSVRNFGWKVRRQDGTQRLCQLNSGLWRDPEGGVRGYLSIARDVTEQRQAEEDRLRLFTAIEQSQETIVITDADAKIQYVNPAFERLTGYTREEAMGANPGLVSSGHHDEEFYKELWETLSEGNVWVGHFINKKKDGTVFEEEATISPIKNAFGDIVNYVAVKRDVSKEKDLQKQLVKAQRMESIATLAAGIAHDFNNLLAITTGYSELLLLDKEKESPGFDELQAIHQASQRGADLVQRILTFSRKVETKPRPTNLNDEVESAKKLLDRTIPRMVDIELELARNLPTINVDPGRLEQILMNLAINAKDAMPDGGKLIIRTEEVHIDEEYCRTHLNVTPGPYVLLEVSDTGMGIDKEHQDRIFEPFYSTKKPGEGTGLGLAMVFGIVKSHKGFVDCYSEPGLGTTFKIFLPVENGPELSDMAKSIETPAFGTECILLVDDEELIRILGKRLLTKAGYTVLTACNGKEALEIYREEKDRLSLVILDLIMPETGGKQCLEKLLEIDAEAKIVIASGYSGDLSAQKVLEMGAKGFINKPFQSRKLLRMVRKAIDEG